MAAELKLVLRRNLKAAFSRFDLEAAAALLAELKEADPLALETRGFEVEYLTAVKRLEEAQTILQPLLAAYPESARVHYLGGKLAYEKKDYGRAEQMLEESYRLFPNRGTRRLLAKALTQAGKFDAAEAHLQALIQEMPACRLDLAWLYERKQEPERALGQVRAYLEKHPGHEGAIAHQRRLQARLLEPASLVEEVENLIALGEKVPDDLLPLYCRTLLQTGQGTKAKEFVRGCLSSLEPRAATRMGWEAYHLETYDLALDLFLAALPAIREDPKFFSAIEKAARETRRQRELASAYGKRSSADKKYFGRLKRLWAEIRRQEERA